MDSKAKQRLTGAMILVALFVLLVPEMLTGPAKPPTETTDDSGLRRITIDIDSPQSSVQPAAPATPPEVKLPEVAQAAPERSSAPAPAPREDERAQPGEAATVATPAPTRAPTNPVATTPTQTSTPASTTARTTPTPAPAQTSTQVPRPTPAAAPAPAPAPQRAPAASAGSFAVQLGTFENKDNANRLVRDMTAKGFAAFVAPFKTNGREMYRVRVGPTRDRAAAEALAAQLKRVGQSGSVVAIS
jgi:DedD protein